MVNLLDMCLISELQYNTTSILDDASYPLQIHVGINKEKEKNIVLILIYRFQRKKSQMQEGKYTAVSYGGATCNTTNKEIHFIYKILKKEADFKL